MISILPQPATPVESARPIRFGLFLIALSACIGLTGVWGYSWLTGLASAERLQLASDQRMAEARHEVVPPLRIAESDRLARMYLRRASQAAIAGMSLAIIVGVVGCMCVFPARPRAFNRALSATLGVMVLPMACLVVGQILADRLRDQAGEKQTLVALGQASSMEVYRLQGEAMRASNRWASAAFAAGLGIFLPGFFLAWRARIGSSAPVR